MDEREPQRHPDGAPPAAQGWYARMERQSAPPSQAGPPPEGSAAPPRGAPQSPPPTAVLPTAPPGARPPGRRLRPARRAGRPTRRPSGRGSNRDLVWWALGALVLGAAAVAAILLGDEPRGTSPAGAGGTTATDDARTPEPTSPSADDAVGTPTGTSPTGTTLPTTGSPTSSSAGEDPLGIGVLMTPPACDGTWIVIAGSATDPATYPEDVSGLLSAVPSAKYVLTAGQCPSLRQQTAEGNQIYAVYLGPFPDQASACATSTGIGGGAYVKQMDAAIPPERTWEC